MHYTERNYQRSNAIRRVDFAVPPRARMLAKDLLKETSTEFRQITGQELLDELSRSAEVEPVKLKVSATRQYHKREGGRMVFKQYGYYRPRSRYLYIQNQTPMLGHDVAPKTFIDTLLHEWLHHYDYQKLKINSIHTSGFYWRLRDVKEKLG